MSTADLLPPNSLYFIFNEKNKDPIKILDALDKRLQSENIGEQCESILFFAKLVSHFPFPSIVSSSFLKLADLYHGTSNNVIRYCIGKVFKEQAISNNRLLHPDQGGDESTKDLILQRLLQPLHSSDPIAKALTLRTLGSMSVFLADDLGMQHSIRNCLSSTNSLEASAAIYAVDGVCERSPIFARSILPYIAELIQGLNCTPKTKLKLIYVLRHMNHDPEMINEARKLLEKVLQILPSHIFVVVTLHTLSLLCCSSLLFINQQLSLLIKYLDDPRRKIRLLVIKDIRSIIENASHHIQVNDIPVERLVTLLQDSNYIPIRKELLLLFKSLYIVFGSLLFNEITRNNFFRFCETFLHLNNDSIQLLAADIISIISTNDEKFHCLSIICLCFDKQIQDNENVKLIENLTFILTSLVKKSSNLEEFLLERLSMHLDKSPPHFQVIIAKGIHRIIKKSQTPSVLLPTLIDTVKKLPSIFNSSITGSLIDALFHCIQYMNDTSDIMNILTNIDNEFSENNKEWQRFIIARSASCYGFHSFSSSIYQQLTDKVGKLSLHYWLASLNSLSEAENLFCNGNLSSAKSVYLDSLTSLRAARLKNVNLSFQEEYINLRQQFISNISSLFGTIPIIAHAVSYLDQHKIPFIELGKKYKILRRSFFDLDESSLFLIEIDEIICSLISFAIGTVLNQKSNSPDPILLQLLLESDQHSKIKKFCADTFISLQNKIQLGQVYTPIQASQTLYQITNQLIKIKHHIPRYYFKSNSTAAIQISTKPSSPLSGGNPVNVLLDSGVVLNINGVYTLSTKKNRKEIKEIRLTIVIREKFSDNTVLQSLVHPESDCIHSFDISTYPNNDSFVATTILSFPKEGKYTIIVKCKIIDSNNIEWIERKNSVIQILVKENLRK